MSDPTPQPPDERAESERAPFDFDAHRREAEEAYRYLRPKMVDLAEKVRDVLQQSLMMSKVHVHSVEARAKDVESFGRKAASPSPEDPEAPRYPSPLVDITDQAAARVITFILGDVGAVAGCVEREFRIIEMTDKSAKLVDEQRLGYQSIHFLVEFSEARLALPEYARFRGMVAELQVRTILQHAWAEIEHDIQYKAVDNLPISIQRRFLTLAGMLEVGDREFQAIADQNESIRTAALRSVAEGNVDSVELTPDSLKAYLDQAFGADGRMRDFSYQWATRLLKRLGFTSLGQLKRAIAPYDDDRISRVLNGSRQGQLTRLEETLLASMGSNFIDRHPYGQHGHRDFWNEHWMRLLERLRLAQIAVGDFDPLMEQSDPARSPFGQASLDERLNRTGAC